MAEWLYEIHRLETRPGFDLDSQLQTILQHYGSKGWELVQILPEQEATRDAYRLIFKSQKPID